MSENTEHDRWQAELPAYLLGALAPRDEEALRGHLETCADCRAELRWLQPAVDLLPDRVERVEAPEALRARVMAEVHADVAEAGGPTASSEAARPRRDTRRQSSWSRMRQGWRPLAAGAMAVLVLAAGVSLFADGGSDGTKETTIAVGKAPGVTATITMEDPAEGATLRLANVGEMPDDRVLEAWVQRGGEVSPVRGLFVPDRDGNATATIPDMRGVEVVMVTAEPRGGSESPTSAPMVTIETA